MDAHSKILQQIVLFRGSIASSNTFLIHLKHAKTFWNACAKTRKKKQIEHFHNENVWFSKRKQKINFANRFPVVDTAAYTST